MLDTGMGWDSSRNSSRNGCLRNALVRVAVRIRCCSAKPWRNSLCPHHKGLPKMHLTDCGPHSSLILDASEHPRAVNSRLCSCCFVISYHVVAFPQNVSEPGRMFNHPIHHPLASTKYGVHLGRGDNTVGNPHRARSNFSIRAFELRFLNSSFSSLSSYWNSTDSFLSSSSR